MANKPTKKCSLLLAIRKIKATMKYHCKPISMVTSRENQVPGRKQSNKKFHTLLVEMQSGTVTWQKTILAVCYKLKYTFIM